MKVALTFDDGPSEWTGPILDLLAENQAQATFFVIGNNVVWPEPLLLRMLADGHEIGNHTTTHPHLSACDEDTVQRELLATQTVIARVTGYAPTLWRAPHFDLPDYAERVASEMGLRHIGCDLNTGDWATPSAAAIADTIARNLRDGDIVDLHDGIPATNTGTESRQPTVDAVRITLAEMRDVEFVTVSEL